MAGKLYLMLIFVVGWDQVDGDEIMVMISEIAFVDSTIVKVPNACLAT